MVEYLPSLLAFCLRIGGSFESCFIDIRCGHCHPAPTLSMKLSTFTLVVLSPVVALAPRTSRDGTCGGDEGFTCLNSGKSSTSLHDKTS
jgi:hypothetical protein